MLQELNNCDLISGNIGEKISVCLLTYNHVDVIESTLQSILDQTITGYEVIVSDDCSTDGTWERILELAAMDPRIKPIQTPHNMAMPGNANFAVAQSTRPYIALLHHDDLYREDLLEKWLGVMERHSDVGFVFNSYGVYQSSFVNAHPFTDEKFDGKWFLETHIFPQWGCPVRGTAMIRRRWWDRLGGMREQFGLLADVDLWMRLAAATAVGYVPEPVITVRFERPDYYPEIYRGNGRFWERQRFLYKIHAANRLAYFDLGTFAGRFKWWGFRLRLSLETAKWLAYAVVRRKFDMIATSGESATNYDLWWLRIFRQMLRSASGLLRWRAEVS